MALHSKRLGITLLILASLGTAFWYLNRPMPIGILVEAAETGSVEQTVANTRAGTVKACRRARLSPGIGGQISVLDIKEGQQVKSGDLLLELWNRDLTSEIELKRADAETQAAAARAACFQAEVAQREASRLTRLRKSGAASEERIDKAETEAKARQADCESAKAASSAIQAQIAVVRAKLERTRLLAPFDGVIAEIHGELNEYVTPSPPGIPTPPAVDLIDDSCFYVVAPIDEVDAPEVATGQPARLSLDAFGDRRFPGRVRRIADYVLDREKQARTVEVEVEFSNPEDIQQLLAGYSADVEIILDLRKDTLRIPTEAVIDDQQVYLFQPGTGLLERREIKTGMSNWDHTEVLAGLEAGDLVVTSVDREGVEDGVLARREAASDQ